MTGPTRIRLVVLLEDLEFGGTQRYAVQLLKQLDRTMFAPEVWTLRGGEEFLPELQANGVKVVYLTKGRQVGPRGLLRLALQLWRNRPELLYTLTVLPNIWGRLFAGLMGIPVVSGYRNLHPRQHEQLLHRLSRRIIANAEALKHEMVEHLGVPPERIAVIANAVDADDFSPHAESRSDVPLVVCIARQERQKDIPTLLSAFRRVQVAIPEARLEIVGNGSLRFEAPPNTAFLPGRRDIQLCLRRAWLLVLSSAADEGMPNAVLEAMACGLPVVATNVGGVPELVVHGKTGLIVPPGDPEALSDALISLLRDGELRQSMGKAGRQRALAEFSIPRMVQQTETVLREVVPTRSNMDGNGGRQDSARASASAGNRRAST